MKKPTRSIYIHIPFCLSKCHYCSFISFADKEDYFKPYFKSLKEEIKKRLAHNKPRINTIYIGGGTPTLAPVERYIKLFNTIQKYAYFDDDIEITFEANPKTLNKQYLSELKKLNVNRLSIGVQSFNDEILKSINRPHNAKDAINTIKFAQGAGFENINIDLIYGLPMQTPETWLQTLQQAEELGVNHISTYGLKIEKGTHFYNDKPVLPDDDECALMYESTVKFLRAHEFEHYEISNFAKKGYQARHNTNYWESKEYYGFGIGSHSFVSGERFANTSDIKEYFEKPTTKAYSQMLTNQDKLEEAIFLGMRMKKGLNIKTFEKKYGFNLVEKYCKEITKYMEAGKMTIQDDHLRFTDDGMLVSNYILADFIEIRK